MADDILQGLHSVPSVASQLGCSERTIYNLFGRGILDPVAVPGRRGSFVREADFQRIKRELKEGKHMTAEDQRRRVVSVWEAFERHCSPIHRYRKAMTMALTALVRDDQSFGLDDPDNDVTAWIAGKCEEYDNVCRVTESRVSEDNADRGLRLLVESRPNNQPPASQACPEFAKMLRSK